MLRDQILSAQERYQTAADRHRLPAPTIRIGDKVYLKSENLPSTRPTRKFADKNLGPFTVIGQHGTYAYTLRLPSYLSKIHPVFHISQLEPAFDNPFPGRQEPPPPPEYDDAGNALHTVSAILDSRYDHRRRRCQLEYFVRWLGYEGTDQEASWLSAAEFDPNEEIVLAYHAQYPNKPGPAQIDPDYVPPSRR
jgi:hypothetical protein